MQLEALLNFPRALPAMSRTVSDLLAEMNKDDPSPKRVSDLISQDPSLTTRVLRLSNSAFFRVSRKIGSAEEAVAMLGMTHVRSLVMAAALGSSFKNVPGVNLPQFWRYSLRVADISKSLAGVLRQNESDLAQKVIELVTLATTQQNNLKEVTTELALARTDVGNLVTKLNLVLLALEYAGILAQA